MKQLKPEYLIKEWRNWGHELSHPPDLLPEHLSEDGLTNQSYLLDSNIGKLVLRINHPDSESLGINRQREYLILRELGNLNGAQIAPEIIYSCSRYRYLVYRFIEGRTWVKTDILKPENQQKIKGIIERYQQVQLSIEPRDYEKYLLHYWLQLENKQLINTVLQKEWSCFLPKLSDAHWTPCLSHHDLIAENIIETEDGLRIIDWEYAHLGHPDLDWASITGEHNTLASELLHWMNRLWTLVENSS